MLSILLTFIALTPLFGESAPRIVPDPFLLRVGGMAEPLPVDTLIATALLISGTPAGDIPGISDEMRGLLAEVKKTVDPGWELERIADHVLQFLHEQVFVVYDEFQTRVDVAVEEGTFNCVSSAVIYMIFVRSFGIPVKGIGTEDHAFCSVVLPDRDVDVETTNVHGFDPGTKKEFQDSFGNVTGYSYVDAAHYSGRTELGERELLGLILQNRISMLESRQRYGKAVELAVDRFALAPGEGTRNHMTREISNYAAGLNKRREYAPALVFLDSVMEFYGWDESLRSILGILHYNNIVALLQSDRPYGALDALTEALTSGWISERSAHELRGQAAERIVALVLPTLSSREGLELVGNLLEEGLMAPERHFEFAIMFTTQLADEHAQQDEYLAAAGVIDQAIEDFGADRRLIQARDIYRYNFSIEAHNGFAALFNQKKYEEALELLRIALEHVPESRILSNDLETVGTVISTDN